MKKNFLIILCLVLSINIFPQEIIPTQPKEADFSWRLLEKADAAFDSKKYAKASKLVQVAKINRLKESQWYVYILEQALKPIAVQKVGDNIDSVLSILQERNNHDAINVIQNAINKKNIEYFNNSITQILKFYKDYKIYPEADYLQAKLYRIEGEFSLAKQYYSSAWENSNLLEIPLVKYDILYDLSSLAEITRDYSQYEKTLLLIISGETKDNPIDNEFINSVIKNINSNIDINKFFLLYRYNSYNSIKAFFKLANYYQQNNIDDKFLKTSVMGMLTAITRIEEVLVERELEYSYKDFNHFFSLAIKYPDIVEWGIDNGVWKGFYEFAQTLEINGTNKFAKDMYTSILIYSPEEYWQQLSRERLQKLNSNIDLN